MLRGAGWNIVRSDGTVHQFPIRPGTIPWLFRLWNRTAGYAGC